VVYVPAAMTSPTRRNPPAELLIFGDTIDELFRRILGPKLDKAAHAELAQAGLDLSRPTLPAYPLAVFEKCLTIAAKRLWPERPLKDGLAQLGEMQVDAFASTMVGRASIALLKMVGLRRALQRLTHAWRNANNFIEATVKDLGDERFEVHVNEVGTQPESFLGVLRGGLRHLNEPRRVSIQKYDGRSCTYLIESAKALGSPGRAP